MYTTLLGYLATFCIVVAFIPQAVKVWRTHSTQDVSFWTFAILVTGSVLFIIYAWERKDYPVLITNLFTLGLQSSILLCKLIYR